MSDEKVNRPSGLPLNFGKLGNRAAKPEPAPQPPQETAPVAPDVEENDSPFDSSVMLSPGSGGGGTHRAPSNDSYFQDFFENDDEDDVVRTARKERPGINFQNKYNEIDAQLQKNLKKLREEYPMGGLKAFQFVTTDVLLEAPTDYFERFENDAREVTQAVQAAIADKGQADLMGEAGANPFDVEVQDRAFRVIQSHANEYMERLPYKGIERSVIVFMVSTDIIGLSRIDALWRDRSIDEILINGPFDIQIEQKGKLKKVPSVRFKDAKHLEAMLERVFQAIGKTLSRTTPILDGRLYDQSRIAVTDRSICPDGPNVAIRRHPEKYWTPMELIRYGSASQELFTEVGNWIHKGCSYIVIGGTGSGKTSLLNATSGFYPETQRVLTLEDNLELKMHPSKYLAAALECRPGNPNNNNDRGTTMRDLVKASLRMRPDGIVVGEVRDGAMYDLCQALNTGHWGASSVHANSAYEGIDRMKSLVAQAEVVTADAALSLIASGFDFILMQQRFPEDGSRKITEVAEVDPYPTINEHGRYELNVRPIWQYETAGVDAEGKVQGEWVKVGEMSPERRKRRFLDLTRDLTWDELEKLCTIPEELVNGKHH